MTRRRRQQQITGVVLSLMTVGLIVSGTGMPSLTAPSAKNNGTQHTLTWTRSADAIATSGGRSGGGSFGSSGGGSSSSGSSSGSSGSSSGSSGSSSGSSSSSYSSNSSSGTVSSGPASPIETAIGYAIVFIFAISLIYLTVHKLVTSLLSLFHRIYELFQNLKLRIFQPEKYQKNQARKKKIAAQKAEALRQKAVIRNDVVTVTQIQVAMLATARGVQRQLNEIATETDWETPTGIYNGLQETSLTILRAADSWTHVSAQSKTVSTRERATEHFKRLSMEERCKFDVESLVNINGKLKRRDIIQPKAEENADYIVVTLIIGTAHDDPFSNKIHSAESLKAELLKISTIGADYLMTYEMLWSPQDESDSLTDEELLLNYPYMIQIC